MVKFLFLSILISSTAFGIPWATNDKKDPSGINVKFKKVKPPKLEKYEKHCYNQIKKLSFKGTSYDVQIIGKFKPSDDETVSYYLIREYKKNYEIKTISKRRIFSCMHGLNYFNKNKPHKRKLKKINHIPKTAEKISHDP